MDQELKQRLIGAAVVTALAAIFIPMLFDDPIDDSGQIVSEMTIPPIPAAGIDDTANKLPASAAQVTEQPPGEPLNPELETSHQAPENNEQPEPLAEETGQPLDEQQWVEGSGAEEEPGPIDEDTGNDLSESVREKTSGEDKTSKSAAKPTQQKATAEKTQKSVKPTVTEKSLQKPVNKPVVEPKAEPVKAKSGLMRWYIQAGSFSKKENALSRWEVLHKQGLPVLLETLETDKGPLYRLKVGPELVKKRAFEIRDRLNKQNIKTIVVAE